VGGGCTWVYFGSKEGKKKKNQKTQTTTKQNKNHHALLKRFWCPVERCPRSVARAGGFGEKANKQKTLNKRIMRTLKEMQ
jgi:hypothetical protein